MTDRSEQLMKTGAAWISVGDELLAGRMDDTNATFAARWLQDQGFPLVSKETVPDVQGAIAAAVLRARERAAVVVVSGGIGPTPDDLTRFGIAEALGVEVREDAQARQWLEEQFAARGRQLDEGNAVQVALPLGCRPIRNTRGTACGILHEAADGGILLVTPGVPIEMKTMLEQGLAPLLAAHPARGPRPAVGKVTLSGMPESKVGEVVGDLMARGRDPVVGCYPRISGQVLIVRSWREDGEAAVEADLRTIEERLGPAVVARGEVTIAEVVVESLRAAGRTVAFAESLTGGRTTDLLCAVPGASAVLLAGLATYANSAKVDLLGVSEETLRTDGAVSETCARQMALGARERAGSDVAVSMTGIAGPSGGSADKPVGLVWFGLADATETRAWRRVIPGARPEIRERAAQTALDLVRRWQQGTLPER